MSKSRRKSPGKAVVLTLILVFFCVLLYGTVNARIVRVMNVVADVRNLDSRLDGYRILYVSDFKISNNAEARQAANLLKKLCKLEPDILIIGGDVTGKNLIQFARTLFSKDEISAVSDELTQARDNFFLKLGALSVPCYIVPGDEDQVMSPETQQLTKVTMLSGSWVDLNVRGASVVIAGAPDYKAGKSINKSDYYDKNADFYLFVSHDPRYLRDISLLKRWDGKPLTDMALSAHTLGGQVNIAGVHLLYGDVTESYESSMALDVNTLISEGIGTEYLPVRIGTKPTAYLIMLQRAR